MNTEDLVNIAVGIFLTYLALSAYTGYVAGLANWQTRDQDGGLQLGYLYALLFSPFGSIVVTGDLLHQHANRQRKRAIARTEQKDELARLEHEDRLLTIRAHREEVERVLVNR